MGLLSHSCEINPLWHFISPNKTKTTVWIFLILFILCMYDTRSVFTMNRMNFISIQAFARSPTLASSGVRENVHPTNKLELC